MGIDRMKKLKFAMRKCFIKADRKRTEEKLRRYELLAALSRDIILHMRYEDGLILEANVAAVNAYGYSREELLELTIHDLRAVETQGLTKDQMVLANERGVLFETVHRRKDGSTFPVEVSSQGATINNVRTLVSVIRDITGRKQAEAALQQAHAELEIKVNERTAELREKDRLLLQQSRQAAMGEMINNIAHQWRQPLNALGLIVQTLPVIYEMGDLNRDSLKAMEMEAMHQIMHMSRTIGVFSKYFKPDKEKIAFHVSKAIFDTITLIEGSFKQDEIIISVDVAEELIIYGYPHEYAQVILNILSNARDAFLERKVSDPTITISMGRENGKAVVTITDNAGGIPENVMDRIFDPYFTTKDPAKGTGVGLFISKTIIEKNMGGRLTSRNSGAGAEFRIEVSI
jgi:PAS domain S-box-containing protein